MIAANIESLNARKEALSFACGNFNLIDRKANDLAAQYQQTADEGSKAVIVANIQSLKEKKEAKSLAGALFYSHYYSCWTVRARRGPYC